MSFTRYCSVKTKKFVRSSALRAIASRRYLVKCRRERLKLLKVNRSRVLKPPSPTHPLWSPPFPLLFLTLSATGTRPSFKTKWRRDRVVCEKHSYIHNIVMIVFIYGHCPPFSRGVMTSFIPVEVRRLGWTSAPRKVFLDHLQSSKKKTIKKQQ